MRRPRLTDKRIRGLQLAIERLRPLAENTAGDGLFRLPTDDAHDLRAAVAYVDALARWNHERKGASDGDQSEAG
ncbi:MAG: hypothetical protein Q8Q29_05445 [Actinomycetota bacterium]|nr:hypothetical protein [Actinomycetota bacterium]